MSAWLRAGVGIAVVALAAAAGIVANLGLLRLTQDSSDPVGKLSPRAVFIGGSAGSQPHPDADDGTDAPDSDD